MARKESLTGEKKRLETLAIETEAQKKALVTQLRKTPIVQLACERVGTGRSTYYKWRATDFIFARAADDALAAGKFFINDLAESKLLQMIQEGNITAIIFWLKYNHPAYSNRIIYQYEVVTERKSVEEKSISKKIFVDLLAEKIIPQFSARKVQRDIEEELEEEKETELDKKLKPYDEDQLPT